MSQSKPSRFFRAFSETGFFLGIFILVLVGGLGVRSLLSLIANGQAVTHTLRVGQELDRVLFLTTDAETNQRGYLLTGKEAYLKRYRQAIGREGLDGQIQTLQALAAKDPNQQSALDALQPLIRTRVTEMQEAIEGRRQRGLDGGRATLLQNKGRATSDKIRDLIGSMDREQDIRLSVQTEKRDNGAHRAFQAVVVGSFLAIGLLSISSSLLRREIIEHQRSEAMVRQLNGELEARVQQRTEHLQLAQQQITSYARELELSNIEMLERLAHAGEFRDDDTGQHTQRVGLTAGLLAQQLGFSERGAQEVQQASRLHDLGKIGISDLILLKAGPLTEEEFATMKTHTVIGAALFEDGHSDLIRLAERIAVSHHERWDGRGYPHGLRGEDIPLEGRITAVADVFDALTHERPYKQAWSVAEAIAEIVKQSGRQFDPVVVDAFLTLPHADLV